MVKGASNICADQLFLRGDESFECFLVAKILVLQLGALGQLTQEILDESRVALGIPWQGSRGGAAQNQVSFRFHRFCSLHWIPS
jgi:hypothetical protein